MFDCVRQEPDGLKFQLPDSKSNFETFGEMFSRENPEQRWSLALFLLRCLEVELSLSDLDLLTIGMVLDIWTEKGNDGEKYGTKSVVRQTSMILMSSE